jgi:hypothetical protein
MVVNNLQGDVKNKNTFTPMNFRKIGLLGFLIILVAIYFLNRSDLQVTTQNNFSSAPIGNAGYELNSVLVIKNPNLLSSTIKTITESYFIEGREVARMNIDLDRGIPGLKETSFPINVRFGKADLERVFGTDTIARTIKAEVAVTGEITYRNMMNGGKTLVNIKDSVTITGF